MMSRTSQTKPPSNLRRQGRRLWREVIDTFHIDDPHELELLGQAAAVLDTIAALEAVVAESGPMTVGSTGQPVVHGAVLEARQQRVVLARLISQLGLPARDGEDGVRTGLQARSQTAHTQRWGTVRELRQGPNRGA